MMFSWVLDPNNEYDDDAINYVGKKHYIDACGIKIM